MLFYVTTIPYTSVTDLDPTTVPCTPYRNYLIDVIEQHLDAGDSVYVEFTKQDGTKRGIRCTRNMNLIPQDKHPKGSGKTPNPNLIVVFDLDKNEWRSFHKKSAQLMTRL